MKQTSITDLSEKLESDAKVQMCCLIVILETLNEMNFCIQRLQYWTEIVQYILNCVHFSSNTKVITSIGIHYLHVYACGFTVWTVTNLIIIF